MMIDPGPLPRGTRCTGMEVGLLRLYRLLGRRRLTIRYLIDGYPVTVSAVLWNHTNLANTIRWLRAEAEQIAREETRGTPSNPYPHT